MNSTPQEEKTNVASTTDFISTNKRQYVPPILTTLPARLSINSGNSAYQVENTSGVFNTHS